MLGLVLTFSSIPVLGQASSLAGGLTLSIGLAFLSCALHAGVETIWLSHIPDAPLSARVAGRFCIGTTVALALLVAGALALGLASQLLALLRGKRRCRVG